MIPLPEKYRKNSYEFSLVERTGDVAIYEQREPLNNRVIGYEVFEVQKQEEGEAFGRPVVAKELTPGNEQWGYLGFTCVSLGAAKGKAQMMIHRQNERGSKISPEV